MSRPSASKPSVKDNENHPRWKQFGYKLLALWGCGFGDATENLPELTDIERSQIRRLTDAQRREVYEQEKRRIPMLSDAAKIWIAVYFIGCLMLFFGIPQALIELLGTHKWVRTSESDIFEGLFGAVLYLTRPLLVGFITIGSIPALVMILWAAYGLVSDFVRAAYDLVSDFVTRVIDRD